ncbi:FkbM family methyltransferase [Streptomyces sp. NPDC012888]|uniref:FkbM family methyltransferase n=1 Tax=Streptomyces sp. NPDC012888 TaxID=3364855 RepID=UPI0036B01EDB
MTARSGGGRRGGVRSAAVAAALRWGATRLPFVEDEVAGLAPLVRPGTVCVDVGAEYGLYTLGLAGLTGPSGHVHTVHRTALGARPGRGVLSLPRRRGLPVHGRAYLTEGVRGPGPNAEFRTARPVPVPVRTLDQLAEAAGGGAPIGFVKADVEGAELAVLRGGARTLARHRPALLLEVEDRHLGKYGARSDELLEHLAGYGYRAHGWRGDHWTEVDRITPERRNHLFSSTVPHPRRPAGHDRGPAE